MVHHEQLLSRRAFIFAAGSCVAAGALVSRARGHPALSRDTGQEGAVQQFRRAAVTGNIEIHPVRGEVRMLTGSGGNITVLAGREVALLVDSGIVGAKVAAAVATLTRAPITHVVNTHWHFDHTDANAWMHERGARIVAHRNTRRRLAVDTRVDDWHFTFPASPEGALPGTMVERSHLETIGDASVRMHALPPSHTDTDLLVHLERSDVLCTGDTWWNGLYPFIDYSTGGSIDGTIRAAEASLAQCTVRTRLVPGHGPVGGPADLRRYRDALSSIRDRVAALKRRGHSLDEVVAARPTAPFDEAFGQGPIAPAFFTRLVYRGA